MTAGHGSKPHRAPIWRALCDRGLAESEPRARALVLTGQVLVDDRPVVKPGTMIPVTAAIRVRGLKNYASRGGDKLDFALRSFTLDVTGRVALDAGASTGGFTDCLLQHGVARVYAVDVGYGQLLGRLRQDPRVISLERTNLSAVRGLGLKPIPSLITLDLSYLGLARAWRVVQEWLPSGSDIISLVKPLFEVEDTEARRTGKIEGEQPYVDVLARLVGAAHDLNWSIVGVVASPIRGGHDTQEFLMHARSVPGGAPPQDLPGIVSRAIIPADEAVDPPTSRHPSND